MTSPAVTSEATTFPAAELDRRFYAFTIDRLIAWSVDLGIALLVYDLVIAEGSTALGILLIVATVLLVGLAFAVVQGLQGFTPGKVLLGLRVVSHDTGTPIGIGAAALRTLVLGVGGLPTFGLGAATLAWTAVMDRDRQRRGWHDHVADSIVVDVRPVPVAEAAEEQGPRQIVNLTAMRLAPTPKPVPVSAPSRAPRTAAPDVAAAAFPGGPLAPNTAPPDLPPAPEVPRAPAPPPASAPAPGTAPAPGAHVRGAPPPPAAPPAEPTRPSGASTAERTTMRDGSAVGLVRWWVTFDTGESFAVEGLALVGRRPEPRQGEPVRHLVPLPSQDMSLSKTHAQFQVAPDGVLVVMDRGSTNGSVLIRQGVARDLPAGKPTTVLDGDVVRFGDRQMTVARGS